MFRYRRVFLSELVIVSVTRVYEISASNCPNLMMKSVYSEVQRDQQRRIVRRLNMEYPPMYRIFDQRPYKVSYNHRE